MSPVHRIVLPHLKHGHRAHAISHKGFFSYSAFALIFLLTFQFLSSQVGLVLGYASDIYVDEIISLTNTERERNGLSHLRPNGALSSAAESKAEDMFADDYWAHIAPDGTTPWFFIEGAGYGFVTAGENLAKDFNDSSSVVRAWMDSPTHRDNILGSSYVDIGVAVVNGELAGEETTLVVQMFGSTGSTAPLAEIPAEVEVTPEAVAINEESPAEVFPESARPAGAPPAAAVSETPVRQASILGTDFELFSKYSALLFVLFLLSLFILDIVVINRKDIVRLSGNTWAHIGILLFLFFIVWWSNVGAIL